MLFLKKLAVLSITFTTALTSGSGLGGNNRSILLPPPGPTKRQFKNLPNRDYAAEIRRELKKNPNERKFVAAPRYKEVETELHVGPLGGPTVKVKGYVDTQGPNVGGVTPQEGGCIIL